MNDSEIQTLLAMLTAMADHQDPTDLVLLRHLNPTEKAQLWAVVTTELRQAIHQLKTS
jgi:hypothetical protein